MKTMVVFALTVALPLVACKKKEGLSVVQDVAAELNQNNLTNTEIPTQFRKENGQWVQRMDPGVMFNQEGSVLYKDVSSITDAERQQYEADLERQQGFTAAINQMQNSNTQGQGGFAWNPELLGQQPGFEHLKNQSVAPPPYLRVDGSPWRFDPQTKQYAPAGEGFVMDKAQQQALNNQLMGLNAPGGAGLPYENGGYPNPNNTYPGDSSMLYQYSGGGSNYQSYSAGLIYQSSGGSNSQQTYSGGSNYQQTYSGWSNYQGYGSNYQSNGSGSTYQYGSTYSADD